MRVYIGFDPREQDAYDVAVRSLRRHSPAAIVTPLRADRLAQGGLLRRPTDTRGLIWDLPSNAPCSTEFAISRFLVPLLAQTGWVLFVDCDVVFQADVADLFALADPTKAVMVVKHPPLLAVSPKMDGQAQVVYDRKNWSSVMLWNCDHPANARLSLVDVNERPGRDLHRLYWLADSEIGELSPAWNWLVGERPQPENVGIAHFTNGGPFLPGWEGGPHDDIWRDAWRRLRDSE